VPDHRLVAPDSHIIGRQFILPIPEKADDVRKTRVPVIKCNQYLVVYLWHEKRPSTIATHHRGNPNPIRFVVII
jgi:hypothetical protein